MVRNLFGKSFFIESKEPRRTNRRTRAVSLAQICINCDLAHYRYSALLPPGRTTERLWVQCTPDGVKSTPTLPRLEFDHLAIHGEPAVSMMMDRLRILLYGIGPGFDHFQDEEVELADETGIDHLAFKVGEALGNQGWRHALGWRRRQAESLELVHVPA